MFGYTNHPGNNLYKCKKKSTLDNHLFVDGSMYNTDKINAKLFYNVFLKKKERVPTGVTRWTGEADPICCNNEEFWTNTFSMAFSVTRETYLQTFQYKILHQIIACQKKLKEMKIVQKEKCLYCTNEDDVRHFFYSCPNVSAFWSSFFRWWNGLGDITIASDYKDVEQSIIFGFQARGDIFSVLNYCILIGKHHIYKNRKHNNNSIDFLQYLFYLKSKLCLEEQISMSGNCLHLFEKYRFVYEQL